MYSDESRLQLLTLSHVLPTHLRQNNHPGLFLKIYLFVMFSVLSHAVLYFCVCLCRGRWHVIQLDVFKFLKALSGEGKAQICMTENHMWRKQDETKQSWFAPSSHRCKIRSDELFQWVCLIFLSFFPVILLYALFVFLSFKLHDK